MAKKNAVTADDAQVQAENATEQKVVNRNRESTSVDLSPYTLQSIEAAAAQFGPYGLTIPKARDLVRSKLESLGAGISAVDLFAEQVQAEIEKLKAAAKANAAS